MVKSKFDDTPRENPCAQCGKPISAPEWIEAGPRRTSYLWHCQACGYRFEAMAILGDSEAIAA
jgi:rubredoxin